MNLKSKVALICILSVVMSGVFSACAPNALNRGPYLQLVTSTSIIIRWRSAVASESVVRYGTLLGEYGQVARTAEVTTEHSVQLTGLLPSTRYYYTVGTDAGVWAGGDASFTFLTAPVVGTAKPTRVWVIGDAGQPWSLVPAVRDAYLRFTGARGTDLWLMLGDNAYSDGTDLEYQQAVFKMFPRLLRQVSVWPTLGNHDGRSAQSDTQSGPYYDIFQLPTQGEAGGVASGTEAYYSFDYANIHFVCLDSHQSDRLASGAMMTWLENDLSATTQQWIVAYWHHPPYSKSTHDSDSELNLIEMRENALPILEAHGVDLVLSGHSHAYERSYLLDGHYGVASTLTSSMILNKGNGRVARHGAYVKPALQTANQGAVYVVAGGSSNLGDGPLDHPAMYIGFNTLGSVVLDIEGATLKATFLDFLGRSLDRFTISKETDTVAPVLLSVTTNANNQIELEFNEKLDPVSTNLLTNYSLDGGASITSLVLDADQRSVQLNVAGLIVGTRYTLTLGALTDVAGNAVLENTSRRIVW